MFSPALKFGEHQLIKLKYMLTLYFGRSGARDKVFKVLRPLSNCQVKDRRLVIKWLYLYIVDGHFQLKVILTLWARGIDWTGSFLITCFKGVSVAQRSTRLACHLVACWSILCQLFAQDWPNLWHGNVPKRSLLLQGDVRLCWGFLLRC